jgi:hypothetical protein
VEALLEEGSELTAGWLAVCALLLYLGRIPGYDGWHVRRSAVAAAGLGLLVGMGVCLLVVPAPTDPSYGYASAWFPAAMGALVAAVALEVAAGVGGGAVALAAGLVPASAFFGSQARLWVDEQGAAHPIVRWAVPAAVLLAAVAGSLVAARRSAAALGLVAACALLAVALARGGTGSYLMDGVAMLAFVLVVAWPAAPTPALVRSSPGAARLDAER